MSHPSKYEVAELESQAVRLEGIAGRSMQRADKDQAELARLAFQQAKHARWAAVLELARKVYRDLMNYGSSRLIEPAKFDFNRMRPAEAVAVADVSYLDVRTRPDQSILDAAMEAAEQFTP